MYIEIPNHIDRAVLDAEFGKTSAQFYVDRIKERERQGHYYPNPIKTAYIWAAKDRQTKQGYYSTWNGFKSGRKKKNHGKS